jgi:hypothetical protein
MEGETWTGIPCVSPDTALDESSKTELSLYCSAFGNHFSAVTSNGYSEIIIQQDVIRETVFIVKFIPSKAPLK